MKTLKSNKIRTLEDLDIQPVFSFYHRDKSLEDYLAETKKMLFKLFPSPIPFKNRQGFEKWLNKSIPLFEWIPPESPPSILTISLLTKPLKVFPSETFFQEMIKRWLIPHSETTIVSFQHMLFYFDHYLKAPFFIAEAKILVRDKKEHDLIKMNLPLLKNEIIGAVNSGNFAKSILESKGLPVDRKLLLVRDSLLRLMQRFPDDFDEQILHRFAYAQAYTSDEFKKWRSFPHLTRIIASMYLIRNDLERELRMLPERRHIKIRFAQTKLTFSFGKKPVLGIIIGLNFFHKFEFFEEKHILLSVQKFFPEMRLVSKSFYAFCPDQSPICTIYVELEKEDGSRFFPGEIRTLRSHLVDEFSKRIEHLVPSLFMVRNEEEVMRNILLLSQEIKTAQDLPQMMISFDQHSQEDLIFTVVLVRIKNRESSPVQDLLSGVDPKIRFIPDRVQNVRFLNKSHPIEANVFRLQIRKLSDFLRMDFSVNLYLARQEVVTFLNRELGEIRDYNGGMILKQGELLGQFKRLFQDLSERNQDFLENFFYALSPIETQATIPLSYLSFFFDLFLHLSEKEFPKKNGCDVEIKYSEGGAFAALRGKDSSYRSLIEDCLKEVDIYGRSLVSASLFFEGSFYLGYHLAAHDSETREIFKKAIFKGVEKWIERRKKRKILRLATSCEVFLDPRIKGDHESAALIKMLFDGLMRRNLEGKIECAIAQSYIVSQNKLRYTFKLRKTYWSDGSPLIAYDFEYAWKKILSPNFSTFFSSLFYPILNAEKAKNGLVDIEQVGIKAIDTQTLVIDLEYHAPYFLELITHTLYSPVNHRVDQMHPNWYAMEDRRFICNGPFRLKKRHPIYTYEMERNPYYWRSQEIYFDQVLISNTKIKTSLEMFRREEIDYIGPPLQSFEDYCDKVEAKAISSYPSNKLSWIALNTKRFPFTNLNMRRALAASIHRKDILEFYKTSEGPAYTILPRSLTQHYEAEFLIRENSEKAKIYFQKALKELGIKREDIPVITLYFSGENKQQLLLAKAIVFFWENLLGIKCQVEACKWFDLFNRMTLGQYQAGMIKWYSWFEDPIYTLDAFKYQSQGVNFSHWENPDFQQLLELSNQERDNKKRMEHLAKAEEILIRESPVIPLFYDKHCFLKNSKIKILPETLPLNGSFDFSQMFFEESSG